MAQPPFPFVDTPRAALYNAAAERLDWNPAQVDAVPDYMVSALIALIDQVRRITAEQVTRDEKGVNDQQADISMPPLATGPEAGATVHYLGVARDGTLRCLPASVDSVHVDGRLNLNMPHGNPIRAFDDAVEEAQSARLGRTWHWPCDKSKSDATPESDGPPISVTVHVHGSVFSERELHETVARAVRKHLNDDMQRGYTRRDGTPYAPRG